jgi:hypothetical protein
VSRLRVAPIVEGHGEDQAIRILLQRTWTELLGGQHLETLKPVRWPRTRFVRGDAIAESELNRAVRLALSKLVQDPRDAPAMVLLLVDADEQLPCVLAPQLIAAAHRGSAHVDISCVLANKEYETWFVAAAASLERYLDLSEDRELPINPEEARLGKAWVEKRFRGTRYSPTVDQPALTQAMDLRECRRRSPSFDKLCRELERRMEQAAAR